MDGNLQVKLVLEILLKNKTKVQLKIRYTKEGKIPKVNDDQFENAYRLALLDIEYVDPIDEDDWRNEPEKKILSGVDAGY